MKAILQFLEDLTTFNVPKAQLVFLKKNLLVLRSSRFVGIVGGVAESFFLIAVLCLWVIPHVRSSIFPGIVGAGPYLSFFVVGVIGVLIFLSSFFEMLGSIYRIQSNPEEKQAVLLTPVSVKDYVFSELLWASCKSFIVFAGVLLLLMPLFPIGGAASLFILIPYLFLSFIGTSLAILVALVRKGSSLSTLVVSFILLPLALVSGALFPVAGLPGVLGKIVTALPVYHSIEMARDVVYGELSIDTFLNLTVLSVYTLLLLNLSMNVAKRKLS
jgi:ABC-2 type transport system permease protein